MSFDLLIKMCKGCGFEKPFSEFSIRKKKGSTIYYRGSCKVCIQLSRREYEEKNKENRNKSKRDNYSKNKEKFIKSVKEYASKNKEKKREYNKQYNALNKVKISKQNNE